MATEINWPAYRAEVAKLMLPVIYARIPRKTGQWKSPEEIAIEDTVNIAIDMANMLEQRLKGG